MEATLTTNNTPSKEPAISKPAIEHESPSVEGKTAAEYVYEAVKLHGEQYKGQGKPPPKILEWIGDAALSNEPKNRAASALGLTAGLLTSGTIANIVTGYSLSGKKIANVPHFLKPINGLIKGYDPKDITLRNKFIRHSHALVYSLGGLVGIKIATDMVYKQSKERDKNPQFLEDYLSHVSKMQGDNWSWLSAASGIWGSASGMFLVPVPGMNYGIGMVGRVTSMQDRNTTLAGLNKTLSDSTTNSYLRLKEGAYYLTHYAVGNPAKDPQNIEYIAYSILGPIFKDKLTAKHIKQFTDAVHEVRDRYWQPGGIPKDKQAEATDTMKQVFTGAGLEVLLIDMGLNPASVAFDKTNGLIGKIGNINHARKIHEKQEKYWSALEERLPKYVNAGVMAQERADWVKEGIDTMRAKGLEKPAPAYKLKEEPAQEAQTGTKAAPQSSIDKLIESSARKGDWRAKVLQRRQESTTPGLVAE